MIEVPQLVLLRRRMFAVHDHIRSRIFTASSDIQHLSMHLAYEQKLASVCKVTILLMYFAETMQRNCEIVGFSLYMACTSLLEVSLNV